MRPIWVIFGVLVLVSAMPSMAQTLAGAIDMHAHPDPHGTPRSIDAIDLARLAKSLGMRAIVLKNQYEPTASLTYLVRKEVLGIKVFGGYLAGSHRRRRESGSSRVDDENQGTLRACGLDAHL